MAKACLKIGAWGRELNILRLILSWRNSWVLRLSRLCKLEPEDPYFIQFNQNQPANFSWHSTSKSFSVDFLQFSLTRPQTRLLLNKAVAMYLPGADTITAPLKHLFF